MSCTPKQSKPENKRAIGTEYEKLATRCLIDKGYTIVCNNYRCKTGEIDIIAELEGCIVFVEVKYKASTLYGYPREAVTYRKQQRILLAAKFYLRQYKKYEVGCRFDVIEVLGKTITHIEAAF